MWNWCRGGISQRGAKYRRLSIGGGGGEQKRGENGNEPLGKLDQKKKKKRRGGKIKDAPKGGVGITR